MNNRVVKKHIQRRKRALRVRSKLNSVSERPRLSVFRSNKHISAQIIDDIEGKTLVSASSHSKALSHAIEGKKGVALAEVVGAAIGAAAKEKGITVVSFDRGPYKFHGVIKALADTAREKGLEF